MANTPAADKDPLCRKVRHLARVAPDVVRGLDMLVDDALLRYQEEARAQRLLRRAMFRRVK